MAVAAKASQVEREALPQIAEEKKQEIQDAASSHLLTHSHELNRTA